MEPDHVAWKSTDGAYSTVKYDWRPYSGSSHAAVNSNRWNVCERYRFKFLIRWFIFSISVPIDPLLVAQSQLFITFLLSKWDSFVWQQSVSTGLWYEAHWPGRWHAHETKYLACFLSAWIRFGHFRDQRPSTDHKFLRYPTNVAGDSSVYWLSFCPTNGHNLTHSCFSQHENIIHLLRLVLDAGRMDSTFSVSASQAIRVGL